MKKVKQKAWGREEREVSPVRWKDCGSLSQAGTNFAFALGADYKRGSMNVIIPWILHVMIPSFAYFHDCSPLEDIELKGLPPLSSSHCKCFTDAYDNKH